MAAISTPEAPQLLELCAELARLSDQLKASPDDWPREQLKLCGEAGVYEWFVPQEFGGQGWSDGDIYRAYLRLAAACLTTTFVITQRMGASHRIASGGSAAARSQFLPALISGDRFATVGVSHLTTSGRHLKRPLLRAEPAEDGFILDGLSPWVTGGEHADLLVLGATLEDGREILAVAPTDLPGLSTPRSADLVGLGASCTGPVRCDSIRLPAEGILAGPKENVMQRGTGASTGGLQTSVLAVGLASACLDYIRDEAARRPDLASPLEAMQSERDQLKDELISAADGIGQCNLQDFRVRANSLALRSSQASLAAAKGAGYVVGHPAGRWCQEALFFLVWSCPQTVMNANMCEFAGIES